MFNVLLSLPVIGMLFCGALEAPPNSSYEEKPKALITKTFASYNSAAGGYTQLEQFGAYCDIALEEAVSESFDVSFYEHTRNVPALEMKNMDVHFELELSGIFDVSSIQSKEKTRMTIKKLRQVWLFDHYYKGEVRFQPSLYLIIKTPQMQQLIDRIEIPLDQYSVYIENVEPSESFDISSLLAIEKVVGITDVIDNLLEEISSDVEDEVSAILSDSSLEEINSKIQTLKNN